MITDHCERVALCHIGLVKDHGGHPVDQSYHFWKSFKKQHLEIKVRKNNRTCWNLQMKRMLIYKKQWIKLIWANCVVVRSKRS